MLHKIDHFFIHSKLHHHIEEFGRARILLYAMIITTLFSFSYVTYYELSNSDISVLKHIANVVAVFVAPIGLYFLKFNGKLKFILVYLLIVANFLIFTSTFLSGGIYSVDLLWMVVITMIGFLFTGNKGGLVLMALGMFYFLLFYILDNLHIRDFESDSKHLGTGYKLYTLYFLLSLASIITYFFITGVDKIKKELDILKENEVRSLDYKFGYITQNVNEIIGLHTDDGRTTYISPAIEPILGYTPQEMEGLGYISFLGGKVVNKEFKCQHKNGQDVWLDLHFHPIKGHTIKDERYISIARDISSKVYENIKLAKMRQQIANDFHDEMGNKLASITLNSSILGMKVAVNEELTEMVSKIEETSKSLYEHSRDFIWSIDSKSDELGEIFAYIRDFGEDFFHSLHINFRVTTEGGHTNEKIILPLYWGRHITFILKEALTNVAKHAKCSNVVFSFQCSESHFTFSIEDDGKGIPTNVKLGKGILSMKERAKVVQGELEISSNAEGTKISLVGKLPKLG